VQELRLETADRLEIAELMARYGNIIDNRQFSRISEVFDDEAVYDVTDFGMGVLRGPAAVVDAWTLTTDHPLAHHVTNVEIEVDTDGTIRVCSKIIGVGRNGRCGSATYRDIVVRSAAGWRIRERVVTLRRPESIPAVT